MMNDATIFVACVHNGIVPLMLSEMRKEFPDISIMAKPLFDDKTSIYVSSMAQRNNVTYFVKGMLAATYY